MIDGIGAGNLAREAILSALRDQAQATDDVTRSFQQVRELIGGEEPETGLNMSSALAESSAEAPGFADALRNGFDAVRAELDAEARLPEDIVTGKVDDFHEVAARIKRADVSLKFALEVRNKLIDAYREVMRMTV